MRLFEMFKLILIKVFIESIFFAYMCVAAWENTLDVTAVYLPVTHFDK